MNDSISNHPMIGRGPQYQDWVAVILILLGVLALIAGMLKGCGAT